MSDVMSAPGMPHDLGDTPVGHAARLRERMRALIHTEIEKLNPTDDARRALELIIESSLRPSETNGELTLTVTDPSGQPRMTERNGVKAPFTLEDLLVELRNLHPVLFKSPPRPQAVTGDLAPAQEHRGSPPPPKVEPKRDWLQIDVKPQEAETTPEASLGAHALEHWRKGRIRIHAWSRTMSDRLTTPARRDDAGASAPPGREPPRSLADSKERAEAFFDRMQEKSLPRRPGLALGIVAALLLALATGAFLLLRPGERTQAEADGPSRTGALASNQNAEASAPVSSASNGGPLRGVPDVIDTATLSLQGEVVRLFGVEWAPGGGKPEDLTAYLQGREVTCEPAGGNDTYRCTVGGQDLSRVVLYNGGGQPTAQATPELKAAAQRARDAKIGVWSKQP